MNAAQLINQDSGDTEYYTPIEIVDAAREVMGGIDLDPASSWQANQRIRATTAHYESEDGLRYYWRGRVWMNHPFSKGWIACDEHCNRKTCRDRGYHVYKNLPSNEDWINHLIEEWKAGRVTQSCNITFAATSEAWFQPLLIHGTQCFLHPRTNYYLPDGTKKRGVTKGSVVTYLGPHTHRFKNYFEQFGVVK